MKWNHVLIPCLLLFSCVGEVFSQSTIQSRRYSIAEAIALALRNNPEIKAAARRVSQAETKTLTAGSLDDPMFMYRDWGTPLSQPWNLNQAQQMFAIQQTFPGKGKRAARSSLSKDEVDMQRAQIEALRQDIASRVRINFISLLRNADEMRLHDKQAKLLRDALETVTSKYTVGKVPQADVLRAQILETKLTEHLLQLEQERDLARAELNTLMGVDPSSPLEVVGEYRSVMTLPRIEDLERTALEHRPELATIRVQIQQGEHEGNVAALTMKPDFTIALGYMLNPPGLMERNNYMAEFNMTLPWLNRERHENEVKQAKVSTEVANAELEMKRAAVFLEIESALIKVRVAQKSMKLYRDTLQPQAEATFQAALAAYQNDRADFLSLIDSENMLLEIETSYFKAAAETDARMAELDRAVGNAVPKEVVQESK